MLGELQHTVLVEAHIEADGPGEVPVADNGSVNCQLDTHIAYLADIVHHCVETCGRRFRGLEENLAVDCMIEVQGNVPVVLEGGVDT